MLNIPAILAKKHASLIVNNWLDLPSASLNPGGFMRVNNVGYAGADVVSIGGDWLFRGGEIIMGIMSAPVTAIVPAATFTGYTLSSAASGADTLITATGAHGLTAAFAVGKSIYVSAGTGWTPGFYAITAIALDTTGTSIQIALPYSAGRGAPTIALPNTLIPFMTLSLPPLLNNSVITTDVSFEFTNSATSKTPIIKLGATEFFNSQVTTNDSGSYHHAIRNKGSKTAQVGSLNNFQQSGWGSTTGSPVNGTEDTTNGATLYIGTKIAGANLFSRINVGVVRLIR